MGFACHITIAYSIFYEEFSYPFVSFQLLRTPTAVVTLLVKHEHPHPLLKIQTVLIIEGKHFKIYQFCGIKLQMGVHIMVNKLFLNFSLNISPKRINII